LANECSLWIRKRLEVELAEAQSRSAIDEQQCDEVTSEAGRQVVAMEDEILHLRERVREVEEALMKLINGEGT
jgi:hypothetical protein